MITGLIWIHSAQTRLSLQKGLGKQLLFMRFYVSFIFSPSIELILIDSGLCKYTGFTIGLSHLPLFTEVTDIAESSQTVVADWVVKFESKTLRCFQNNRWVLEHGRLPDFRFQDVNIKTNIQKYVDLFMTKNDLVY
jgi:hypothetical protein